MPNGSGNSGITDDALEDDQIYRGPLIDHNVVRAYREVGISDKYDDYDVTTLRIQMNAVLEGDDRSIPFLIRAPNVTFDGNVCEVAGPCDCELDYLPPEAGVNPTSSCF